MQNDWNLPWEGECRCGQTRFRVSAPPLLTMACHCRGCQRMTASAFSLSALIPSTGFAVTHGEPVLGGVHGEHQQWFCPHCKSWMFTRIKGMDQLVNIRPTMLEDVSWVVPYIETYTIEKLPWATTPAAHRYERFPPVQEFTGLLAEYAQQATTSGP
jgi:hypothetical protein